MNEGKFPKFSPNSIKGIRIRGRIHKCTRDIKVSIIVSLCFCRKAIPAGEEIEETVTFKAKRAGKKEVIVTFSSNQLSGLSGSAEIYIKYQQ